MPSRFPKNPDRAALEQLRRQGANLSRVHELLSWFDCPDEQSARWLANALLVEGLSPTVLPPDDGSGAWHVMVSASLVPTFEAVAELREAMEAAARKAGAEYDGWEAEAVR